MHVCQRRGLRRSIRPPLCAWGAEVRAANGKWQRKRSGAGVGAEKASSGEGERERERAGVSAAAAAAAREDDDACHRQTSPQA